MESYISPSKTHHNENKNLNEIENYYENKNINIKHEDVKNNDLVNDMLYLAITLNNEQKIKTKSKQQKFEEDQKIKLEKNLFTDRPNRLSFKRHLSSFELKTFANNNNNINQNDNNKKNSCPLDTNSISSSNYSNKRSALYKMKSYFTSSNEIKEKSSSMSPTSRHSNSIFHSFRTLIPIKKFKSQITHVNIHDIHACGSNSQTQANEETKFIENNNTTKNYITRKSQRRSIKDIFSQTIGRRLANFKKPKSDNNVNYDLKSYNEKVVLRKDSDKRSKSLNYLHSLLFKEIMIDNKSHKHYYDNQNSNNLNENDNKNKIDAIENYTLKEVDENLFVDDINDEIQINNNKLNKKKNLNNYINKYQADCRPFEEKKNEINDRELIYYLATKSGKIRRNAICAKIDKNDHNKQLLGFMEYLLREDYIKNFLI